MQDYLWPVYLGASAEGNREVSIPQDPKRAEAVQASTTQEKAGFNVVLGASYHCCLTVKGLRFRVSAQKPL